MRAFGLFRSVPGRWLPSTTNQLPPNASHQVGVGAMIVNDAGEMLVVREKNGEPNLSATSSPKPKPLSDCRKTPKGVWLRGLYLSSKGFPIFLEAFACCICPPRKLFYSTTSIVPTLRYTGFAVVYSLPSRAFLSIFSKGRRHI